MNKENTFMKNHLDLAQRKELHGKEYVSLYQQKSSTRLRFLLNLMALKNGSDVVDFGCGDALIIEYIKDIVTSYKGIDFSPEFIQVANKRKEALHASNVDFECNSIVDFSERHLNSFDVGFCLDLSEHVYDNEWQDIVNAMYQCLRPGGSFYQHTPNSDFILEIMKNNNFLLKQFPEHISVRNAQTNCNFLYRAGFEDIKVSFIPHYNSARIVHPLSRLPFIGKFFQARIFITARKPIQ